MGLVLERHPSRVILEFPLKGVVLPIASSPAFNSVQVKRCNHVTVDDVGTGFHDDEGGGLRGIHRRAEFKAGGVNLDALKDNGNGVSEPCQHHNVNSSTVIGSALSTSPNQEAV